MASVTTSTENILRPLTFADGVGGDASIHFAVGDCSLGAVLVAASRRGICAILLGNDPGALRRDLQERFPESALTDGGADFDRVLAQVIDAGARPRSAAGRAGYRLPATGLGCAARHTARLASELLGDRRTDRRAEGSLCRRGSLCGKPDRRRHSLPPDRPQGRHARRLPLGREAQARAARPRGGAVTAGNRRR